jgi:hypothetical protein
MGCLHSNPAQPVFETAWPITEVGELLLLSPVAVAGRFRWRPTARWAREGRYGYMTQWGNNWRHIGEGGGAHRRAVSMGAR